jgi:hypothetical protein
MHPLQMLSSPFDQLRFRIWQRTSVDPQIQFRLGWLAPGLVAWWDVVGTIAAAGVLGWYWNGEAASVTTILRPVALLGIALMVGAFAVSVLPER